MRMTSPSALLFLGILSFTNTFAQKHSFGLHGGMVSSGMSMDYKGSADPMDKAPHFNRITNLYFSVSYGYNFFGKLHMNSGLEFYNKGAIIRFDTGYSDIFGAGTYRYQTNSMDVLTYFAIPVSISRQIHLAKNGRHKLILIGGINFSYLVKAITEGYSLVEHTPPGATEAEPSKVQEFDPIKMKGYNKWDFSVHVGGGYRFQVNDDLGLGIDYRYLTNFWNVNYSRLRYELFDNKSGKYILYSPSMYNRHNHVFSIGIFMSPRLFLGME